MRIFDESLRQLLELKRFEQRKINIETDLTQSQKKKNKTQNRPQET